MLPAIPPSDGPGNVKAPDAHGIGWEGTIPAQKWMNFYTKVLSRFTTTPGLTITVGFKVAPEAVTEAKAQETRQALRELGLPEDLVM